MKKLFDEKKLNKKGIMEFLDRKGFYIVLILCIAIVGGTAVYVTTKGITPDNNDRIGLVIPDEDKENELIDVGGDATKQAIGNATSKTEETVKDTVKTPTETSTSTKASSTTTSKASTNTSTKATATASKTVSTTVASKETSTKATSPKTATTKAEAASPKVSMAKPVFGTITYDYAMDKLVYSKTLDDWRTHSGVDIGADRGTTVHAVADGFVSDIKNDPRFGVTVVVDHKNGLKTCYSNLASDEMVTPNQVVKKGDVLGCIGNTATFEAAEQPHLHFEVWKDGKVVNPRLYLPQN